METSEEKKYCETKKCGCCCHKMGGLFIVLLGVILLLVNLDLIGDKSIGNMDYFELGFS